MKKERIESIVFEFFIGKVLTSTDMKIIKEILMSDYICQEDRHLGMILDLLIRKKEEHEKYIKLRDLQAIHNIPDPLPGRSRK